MEDRSLIAYTEYFQGSQKFGYFVTGVCGALFVYIAQTYEPQKIELSPSTLEPLSLVFLALAFFFGMKRIESGLSCSGENYSSLDAGEKAGNITEAFGRSAAGFNPHSGEVIHPSQIASQREKHMRRAAAARMRADIASTKAERYYSYRNLFLYGGFAAILLSKILLPYS